MLHEETICNQKNVVVNHISGPSTSLSALSSNNNLVMLSTVLLHVYDTFGQKHCARALLDSGSHSNFMSLDLCNRLGLPKYTTNTLVTGIASLSSNVNKTCNVMIES